LAHRVGAAAALQLGSVSEAADHVAQFRAASPAGRIIWGAASFRYVEAQVAEAQCGSERAAEILAPIYDDVPRHKRLLAEEPAAAGWLTRLAMAVDDRPGAARIVTCIEQMADDNRDRPSIVASADQARGLYAADPARLERAAAHHTQAWASAAATEDLAVVLADRGETHASREQLRVAARAYAAAGSPRSEAGARAVMRRVERVATNRPVSGWASLTETESRVAHVVADGLSNPEVGRRMFLSRHTVDFHLRQIYRKLAIHSRVELTRFVLENDAQ
jgi:DNA-binding CsgD family transcriptional regulator